MGTNDKKISNKRNIPHIKKIDLKGLIALEKNGDSKKLIKDRDILLSSYLDLIHNGIALHMEKNTKEMSKFVVALSHYLNHPKAKQRTFNSGDIVEVEFGLRYENEVAFRHTAIVITAFENSVFVVPVTSNDKRVQKAKEENPWFLRVLNVDDGFDHECVAILDDSLFVCYDRILSKIKGKHVSFSTMNKIRKNIMENIFLDEYSDFQLYIQDLQSENEQLHKQLQDKKGRINSLYSTIRKLENKLKKKYR